MRASVAYEFKLPSTPGSYLSQMRHHTQLAGSQHVRYGSLECYHTMTAMAPEIGVPRIRMEVVHIPR